ncbi:hypothetical protein IHC93_17780 [Photobacterium damselae subsp. damselae]|uniref:Lipoprotein n=2 Tax=Photobacterium damselae TaxID=38293 RepID=D0Z429_PHODD|nr:hypothetical protein [Photobacterium damselae]EEZ39267.1 hypothetical protein VDA_000285 [Photobacterium damselae subsp. damselae CIP 102761]UKA27859.1 hypothetical protein IHC93_17780 [Photobacterium damselae subsp. damselae]SPY44347.1 Uncharacterised protein [Photobacterium damselae]
MNWRLMSIGFCSLLLMGCNDDNDNLFTTSNAPEQNTPTEETPSAEFPPSSNTEPELFIEPECDLENINLLDFEQWQREDGWWVGEYTLLGADGNPQVSNSWPYQYDHYMGFIHLEVIGNSIKQRNVFLYPPKNVDECDSDNQVIGNGVCGINGNEKIFSADQSASDCDGNLTGPYIAFGMTMDTHTTLIGDDTVLYQVRMSDGSLMQNQLTSLPPNDTRVRTAQGFFMNTPTYASYYRERKVTKEEFFELITQYRQEYQILETDHCAYDSGNQPSQTTCDEHFELE